MHSHCLTQKSEQNSSETWSITGQLALSCPIHNCHSAQVYHCHQHCLFPLVKWSSCRIDCLAYLQAANRKSDLVRWPGLGDRGRAPHCELNDGRMEGFAHRLSRRSVLYLLRIPDR